MNRHWMGGSWQNVAKRKQNARERKQKAFFEGRKRARLADSQHQGMPTASTSVEQSLDFIALTSETPRATPKKPKPAAATKKEEEPKPRVPDREIFLRPPTRRRGSASPSVPSELVRFIDNGKDRTKEEYSQKEETSGSPRLPIKVGPESVATAPLSVVQGHPFLETSFSLEPLPSSASLEEQVKVVQQGKD